MVVKEKVYFQNTITPCMSFRGTECDLYDSCKFLFLHTGPCYFLFIRFFPPETYSVKGCGYFLLPVPAPRRQLLRRGVNKGFVYRASALCFRLKTDAPSGRSNINARLPASWDFTRSSLDREKKKTRRGSCALNSGVPGTVAVSDENDSDLTAQETVHHPAVITLKNEVSCKFAHLKKNSIKSHNNPSLQQNCRITAGC